MLIAHQMWRRHQERWTVASAITVMRPSHSWVSLQEEHERARKKEINVMLGNLANETRALPWRE